jgi:hypothetical protein
LGKTEVKKSLLKSRSEWENNIKMYPKEIAWEGVNWIDLAKDV